MLKKVKFIYNQSSGEKSIGSLLDQIINIYQSKGYSLSPYRLNFCANQKKHLIADLEGSDYHHVLIAGGDGSVNYVVNLMKSNDIDIPIAVLPAGTANDFASAIGMPSDIIRAVKAIASGVESRVDLGKANNKYFVNVFSCGLFTEVSQKTPTLMKNTFGPLAYYVGGLGELVNLKNMEIEVETDKGNYKGTSLLFFIFNGQTAGNLKLAYLSKVDDGLLDLIIVKSYNPKDAAVIVMGYLNNLRRKRYPSGIVHIQCEKIKIKSAAAENTDIDGQKGPSFPLNIECLKSELRIILPRKRAKI